MSGSDEAIVEVIGAIMETRELVDRAIEANTVSTSEVLDLVERAFVLIERMAGECAKGFAAASSNDALLMSRIEGLEGTQRRLIESHGL